MNLTLQRNESTERSITGILSINGAIECRTLELPLSVNGQDNVHGVCCIPPGTYSVTLVYSPKFKRLMPLVNAVPGRTAIEIHVGNKPSDTEGCILVGAFHRSPDEITGSTVAFDALFTKFLEAAELGEDINLTIVNPTSPSPEARF